MTYPSHFVVNSKTYLAAQPEPGSGLIPYRKHTKRAVVERDSVVGASRFAQPLSRDVLEWTKDDWSKGEGHKFLNPEGDHPSQRGYFTSYDGAAAANGVDASVPGQLSLGPALALSQTAATPGPMMTIAGGTVWTTQLGSQTTIAELTTLAVDPASDAWTARTSGMGGQTQEGNISGHQSGVFIAGTVSGASGGVRRVTAAGNTQWVAEAALGAHVADNRVYYHTRGTTTSTLKRSGLAAAAAGTTMTTFNGVGSTYAGKPSGSVAIGSRIYTLLVNEGEDPRLWVLENDVGREAAVLKGLRISDEDTNPMCEVNGIIFVAGYETLKTGKTFGRLDYYDGEAWGTAATTRHLVESAGVASGGFYCCFPGAANEVVVMHELDAAAPLMWVYDLSTAGMSLRSYTSSVLGFPPFGGAFHKGRYFIGFTNNEIWRTRTSGTGTYLSLATITEPIWDFGLPYTEKLLTEVEMHFATLTTGTSLSFAFSADDGATISTDASGNPMTASFASDGAISRKKFTVSGPSVERVFRYLKPLPALATTTTSNTPTLFSWTIRAIPMAQETGFECVLSIQDQQADTRPTSRQVSGRLQLAEIDTLLADTTNRVFTFKPVFEDSGQPFPHPDATTHNVVLEDAEYLGISAGQGLYRMKLRKVS